MIVIPSTVWQKISCSLALFLLVGAVCTGGFAQNHDNKRLSQGSRRLLPYSVGDGRWGYIDESGNVIVPATFASATFFFGGFGIVRDMDDRCGYIDSSGTLAIPIQFTFCGTFSEGVATVQFSNHVGTDTAYKINAQGKLVFPTKLKYVGEFVDNIAPARKDTEKCGYIDTSENWVTDPMFDYCSSLSDGLAKVEVGQVPHKCGYVDRTGKLAVPLKFDRCESFHEGLAAVAVYVKWNDRVLTGTSLGRFLLRKLSPADDTNPFAEPPSWYPRLSWGYINHSGTWAIAPQYQNASSFSEGRAAVGRDGDMGYVNAKGESVLVSRFAYAEGFHDGYAKVAIGVPNKVVIPNVEQSTEKWGVIDTAGRFVHPAKFPSRSDFELVYNGTIRIVEDLGGNGWAFPGKRARTRYVSASGNVIWPRPPTKNAKSVHSEKPLERR